MFKKLIIAGTILLFVVFGGLYVFQNREQAVQAANLSAANAQIKELLAERETLETRLAEMESSPQPDAEEDGAEPAEPEAGGAVAQDGMESNVVLCLNGMGEDFYDEQYEVIQETGIKGILIQKDGKLPGDNFQMSTQDFLSMLQDGWAFAVTLDREEGQSLEDWLGDVEDYLDKMDRRLSRIPTIFCFGKGTYDSEVLEGLKDLGFTDILYHEGETVDDTVEGLRQICLVDYQADLETARRNGLRGYAGLEMWMNWTDETPEELHYDPDAFAALVSDPQVHFQDLDTLEENEPVEQTGEDVPAGEGEIPADEELNGETTPDTEAGLNTSDSIQQRIDEIDQEIRTLYQNGAA